MLCVFLSFFYSSLPSGIFCFYKEFMAEFTAEENNSVSTTHPLCYISFLSNIFFLSSFAVANGYVQTRTIHFVSIFRERKILFKSPAKRSDYYWRLVIMQFHRFLFCFRTEKKSWQTAQISNEQIQLFTHYFFFVSFVINFSLPWKFHETSLVERNERNFRAHEIDSYSLSWHKFTCFLPFFSSLIKLCCYETLFFGKKSWLRKIQFFSSSPVWSKLCGKRYEIHITFCNLREEKKNLNKFCSQIVEMQKLFICN